MARQGGRCRPGFRPGLRGAERQGHGGSRRTGVPSIYPALKPSVRQVEITSRWDGTVAKLHYETGDMAATGSALLDIDVSDVDGSECGPVAAAHVPDVHAQDVHAPCTLGPVPKFLPRRGERDAGMGKFLTTPSVRCIAREQQLDLAEVLPSGKVRAVRPAS
jgi:pyruvate/2-oxoglutarate dehydrogenase complex dihydrolipoamide acyltransferase (E2) component